MKPGEGGSSKHCIFYHFRLNRCRGCIPEVRGFRTNTYRFVKKTYCARILIEGAQFPPFGFDIAEISLEASKCLGGNREAKSIEGGSRSADLNLRIEICIMDLRCGFDTPAPLQAGGGGFNRSAHSAGPGRGVQVHGWRPRRCKNNKHIFKEKTTTCLNISSKRHRKRHPNDAKNR